MIILHTIQDIKKHSKKPLTDCVFLQSQETLSANSSFLHYFDLLSYTFHFFQVSQYTTYEEVSEVNIMANATKTLSELMKEHQNRLQLTQEEIAELIDCHPQYYKNPENDKKSKYSSFL